MNLKFSKLTDTSSHKFEEVLTIYIDLFPSSERQPPDVVKERIDSGKTVLFIAEIENEVVGFAILWNFDRSDFALLDYLAVDEKWRTLKIGSAIMEQIRRIALNWGKDLILEIELPGEGDNRLVCEKRLRFYLQNGALILKDVPYQLPTLDGTVPTAMLLLAIPIAKTKFYSKEKVTAIIREMYAQVYRKETTDAGLQSFIHLMPEQVELTTAWE